METAQGLFDRARQLEDDGDTQQALETWRHLAAVHPDGAVYCRLARLARKLGLTSEAKDAFERAIGANRRLPVAYIGLASILIDEGYVQKADALLSDVLALEESALAYCLRGVARRELGNDEAAKDFKRAIEIDPSYEESYFNYGMLIRDTDTEHAEKLFRLALQHSPDYADAHRELGWLLSKSLHSADAAYHLRSATSLDKTDAWAYVYLGNHLWRNAEPDAALKQFQEAIAAAPERAFPLWALATFYEDQQEWEEARRLYLRAVELEPDDPVANMTFGRMLKKVGETELAKRYVLRALNVNPEYDAAKRLLAELNS